MGTSKELEVTDHSVQSTPTIVPEDENQLPEVPVSVALESQTPSPPPYHVFSRTRKLQMIFIVSLAAIFSPLSSNIYFPALGEISRDLNVSMSLATLTVTVYMIVQGIAPLIWSSFADVMGRRPIFVGTFVVYIVANIALGVSKNYTELMVFRALQAAGSAATISIGAGAIGDMTTSAERGSLIGIFGGVRMLGQGIGPVFGGILAEYLGFRSIFWFLTIAAGVSLLSILAFLPETLRSIAGNGSVPLKGIYRPFIYIILGQKDARDDAEVGEKKNVTIHTFLAPLRFLFEKDVFLTLFFGAIVYTVWSMITSSTTDLFQQAYNLSAFQIGLTFLGNGFGCMAGSYTIGYFMDYNHRLTEREYCLQHGYDISTRVNCKTHPNFPIERARMRNNWMIIVPFVAATAAFGWSLKTHLAVPIILQFITAFCATGIFTVNSALVVDLYPGASASATATNNLMRCSLGAAGVAVAQPIIDALTAQWTFVLLAGITVLMVPLLSIEMKYGASWRLARAERLEKAAGK